MARPHISSSGLLTDQDDRPVPSSSNEDSGAYPSHGSEPGGLASRLLRKFQASTGILAREKEDTAPGTRDRAEALRAFADQSALATGLQLTRVAVESMAEIRADAERICSGILTGGDQRGIRRLEERLRDLHSAATMAILPDHPPLTDGNWILSLTPAGTPAGDTGEPVRITIPGIRSLKALGSPSPFTLDGANTRASSVKEALEAMRHEIADTRAGLLAALSVLAQPA